MYVIAIFNIQTQKEYEKVSFFIVWHNIFYSRR